MQEKLKFFEGRAVMKSRVEMRDKGNKEWKQLSDRLAIDILPKFNIEQMQIDEFEKTCAIRDRTLTILFLCRARGDVKLALLFERMRLLERVRNPEDIMCPWVQFVL